MSDHEMEIFSQEWAEALGSALGASDSYRRAAANWNGSLVFALRGANGATAAGVYLDLAGGSCHAARRATPADLEGADYLLRADAATWQQLLAGRLEPMLAIMTGRLELARGGVASLLPHAAAAGQLMRTAIQVGGRFPQV